MAGLAKFRTLSIAFRYKSVELFLGRYVICISLYCAFIRLLRFFALRCNCRLSTTACRSFLIQIGYELWLDPGIRDASAASPRPTIYSWNIRRQALLREAASVAVLSLVTIQSGFEINNFARQPASRLL